MYLKQLMDKRSFQNSFHMPSHKERYKFFEKDVTFYDLTEYDVYDNLANPTGVIKNTIERIQRLFKSEKSFILTNGSTVGVLSSVLYVNSIGGEILASRLSHKSFFNAVTITGQRVNYFNPIIDENGFFCKINIEHILDILNHNKNIKSIFITSPTYEGIIFDIKKLYEICNQRDIILIVDEAHGAHLQFSDKFLDSSIQYADIVIQSLHKTMPALTQTALLHCKEKHYETLHKYVNMLQTSSPSYIFMYSIDKLMEDIENNVLDFEKYCNNLIEVRRKIKKLKNIKLLDYENADILKLTIYSDKTSGYEMNNFLMEHNIYPEMYINNYIVLITSVCDDIDVFNNLIDALTEFDYFLDDKQSENIYNTVEIPNNKTVYSLKDADNMKAEPTPLNNCVGKICKDFIIPYPPGVPILLPGEIITDEVVNIILGFIKDGIEVIGIFSNENLETINKYSINIVKEDFY